MPTIFGYVFTFRDSGQCCIFVSFEINIKYKIHCNIRTAHFLRNRRHGFAQWLFPQMYIGFKELRQKFFELEFKHCTLTENLLRGLCFSIDTVTLIHLQRLNDV